MAKKNLKNVKKTESVVWRFPLEKQNLIVIAIGIVVILVGYGLMSTGMSEEPAIPDGKWNNALAVTIAPLLLIIGYCVIIPFGILKKFNKTEAQNV